MARKTLMSGLSDRVLDYQTNVCYLSKLLLERPGGINIGYRLMSSGVKVEILEGTRDIWCRDYMPIQIEDNIFIGYEYAPDYLNNPRDEAYQTNPARIIRDLGLNVTQSGIILDGGNVVKTSKGIIMVDKVFKENNNIPKKQLIDRLEFFFNDEIIFLPWDKHERYGHADGIVREIDNGIVLMTNYHQYNKKYADKFMQILSQHFIVEVLDYDVKNPNKNNWCYINYLRVADKIFIPQLEYKNYDINSEAAISYRRINNTEPRWPHIPEDDLALEQFKKLFVGSKIIQVSCPQIVDNGGALNCISWTIKQ